MGAALEAAPTGCLRSLRRGALCAPAGRPAGLNPLGAILRLGWGEEDPSSVTAYAVTPSPLRGEACKTHPQKPSPPRGKVARRAG